MEIKEETIKHLSEAMDLIDRLKAAYPDDYRNRIGYQSSAFALELAVRRMLKWAK